MKIKSTENKFKKRIQAGNKAYYNNQKNMRDKGTSIKIRMRMYKTLIRRAVMYLYNRNTM